MNECGLEGKRECWESVQLEDEFEGDEREEGVVQSCTGISKAITTGLWALQQPAS